MGRPTTPREKLGTGSEGRILIGREGGRGSQWDATREVRTPLPTPQPPSVVGTVAHERRVLGGKQNPVITTSNIVEARARAGSEHCRVTCDLCGAKREGELCSAGLAGWP